MGGAVQIPVQVLELSLSSNRAAKSDQFSTGHTHDMPCNAQKEMQYTHQMLQNTSAI